jgi:hypothetical protein
MAKAGRKSRYKTHVEQRLQEIEQWCAEGFIETEICKKLGVSVASFAVYKNKYPELTESITKGRQISDFEVVKCLYKKCLGYEYEEVKATLEEGSKNKKRVEKTTKHIPPDTMAIRFWLMNRMPKSWRDKQHIEQNTNLNINPDNDLGNFLTDLMHSVKDKP